MGIPRAAPLFQGSATLDPLQQVQRRTHAGRRQCWIVFTHHGAGAADRCIGSAFALLNKHSSPTMYGPNFTAVYGRICDLTMAVYLL